MGGESRPVTRYEFDLWRSGYEERLRALERWREARDEQHELDEHEQATEIRERRRPWRWREIVAAAITAAGVIAAAAVTALGR